jgi:glycerophosphoryl diester phosphodiesterase
MKPLIIAHRGASHEAPENTLAAFRLAWEQAADAVETDLRLTADGHVVAIHDANGRRTLRDARSINSLTLAELQSLDAGRWRDPQWTGEHVPTLEEILAALPPEKQLVLELKEDLVAHLSRTLIHASLDLITLIAFDAEIIAAAKKQIPACRALWLFSNYAAVPKKRRGEFLASRVRELGVDGVDLRHERHLTTDLLRPLRDEGRTIFVYTINDAKDAKRCADLGVDGITTDRPGEAAGWFGIST